MISPSSPAVISRPAAEATGRAWDVRASSSPHPTSTTTTAREARQPAIVLFINLPSCLSVRCSVSGHPLRPRGSRGHRSGWAIAVPPRRGQAIRIRGQCAGLQPRPADRPAHRAGVLAGGNASARKLRRAESSDTRVHSIPERGRREASAVARRATVPPPRAAARTGRVTRLGGHRPSRYQRPSTVGGTGGASGSSAGT